MSREAGCPFRFGCCAETSMRDVALFVEDYAHQEVIDGIIRRLAEHRDVPVRLDWRNAVGGHGKVVQELGAYLRELRQYEPLPDLIVVATDANCRGMNERLKEIRFPEPPAPMVFAIPDPHIERWLLLDGAAFKAVLGRGCQAPDLKCDRDRYKQRLIRAVMDAGVQPNLGGIEFARDIMREMDLPRAARTDPSLGRFVEHLSKVFASWSS